MGGIGLIRAAQKKDLPQILEIYAPYVEQTTITFEYTVPDAEEFACRFETITAQFPWLVWEEGGAILGYAYASAPYARVAYSWCAEPSIYLRPDARGQGIGKRLYRALEQILAMQGYQILYALITDENSISLDFHAKMGYENRVLFPDCGFKFGRWVGVYWLEKRLKAVEIPSGLPTSWRAIVHKQQKISDILDNLSLSEI